MLKWKMSKDESVFQHYEKSECRKAVYSLDAITERKKREREIHGYGCCTAVW